MKFFLPYILTSPYLHYRQTCENDGQPLGVCAEIHPQAIADALDRLYEDKGLCQQMGKNARKAFETKYNLDRQKESFLHFLRSVISKK